MTESIDMSVLEAQAASLVETALKAGADACDVVVARGQSLGIEVRDARVENTSRSEADEFALRVFVGRKVATVSANNIANRVELAERAVAMAKVSPEDPFQGLAPAECLATDWPDLDLCDSIVADATMLGECALACEAAGLDVAGVSKSMGARAGWGMSGFVLATSTGFAGSYSASRFSASAAMVAGEGTGMERDYEFHSAVHLEDLKDPAEIGRTAGERVVRRLNPRQVASGAVPVIFDRRISSGMLGALMSAINGASVARKTSFLRDRMGKQIAGSGITVTDDPQRRRGQSSRPFDGEGVAGERLTVIERGTLGHWLLSSSAARELGLETNGRGVRGASSVSPSSTNFAIEPGDVSPESLIRGLKTGFYVTELFGHGVNMVTGEYSRGASGFWIEDGELAYPVSEVTIASNLSYMLMNMTAASDLDRDFGTAAPTLLIEGMTLAGS